MKTITEPEAQKPLLRAWRGARADIWLFHVSLRRLAIRLTMRDRPEALYVVGVGCRRITGPFSWADAYLRLEWTPDTPGYDETCRVVDAVYGFELLCSSVVLINGHHTDRFDVFEDLLGDED